MKITILTSKKLKIAIILIFPAKKNTVVRELMTILKFLFTKGKWFRSSQSDIDFGQGAEQTAAGAANPAEEEPRQDRWGCPAAGGGIVAGVVVFVGVVFVGVVFVGVVFYGVVFYGVVVVFVVSVAVVVVVVGGGVDFEDIVEDAQQLGRSPQIFTAHKNWSQTQFPGK